ncbi:MAG: integrase arm-type DNA-binding domain-containing protein [Pelagimonas sp.]
MSVLAVKRLEHPGTKGTAKFAVGGVSGLLLQISPSGAKSWVLRINVNGVRRTIGLGSYSTLSLKEARERAREIKNSAWEGEDLVEERRKARKANVAARRKTVTFSEAMEGLLESKLKEFKNPKHRKQWRSTLDSYAVPVLGARDVAEIELAHVLDVLKPIWSEKTETASRLRGRIEAVLTWASVHGYRKADNPARWKGNLDVVLPKPGKIKKETHRPAVSLKEAPEWFSKVRSLKGFATRALEFAALTAARSGEVRGMIWREIDLDEGVWIVPAGRMKMTREHRVALSSAAINLLEGMDRMADSPFVFPAPRGGQLSDMALSACMKRIHTARGGGGFLDSKSGRPAVPHGLRSTFRDWAAEKTEYPRDMAELALAHDIGSAVEQAYRRSDMLEKRRAMMEDWAKFLEGEN